MRRTREPEGRQPGPIFRLGDVFFSRSLGGSPSVPQKPRERGIWQHCLPLPLGKPRHQNPACPEAMAPCQCHLPLPISLGMQPHTLSTPILPSTCFMAQALLLQTCNGVPLRVDWTGSQKTGSNPSSAICQPCGLRTSPSPPRLSFLICNLGLHKPGLLPKASSILTPHPSNQNPTQHAFKSLWL